MGSNPAIPTQMSQVRGPHRLGGAARLPGQGSLSLRWGKPGGSQTVAVNGLGPGVIGAHAGRCTALTQRRTVPDYEEPAERTCP